MVDETDVHRATSVRLVGVPGLLLTNLRFFIFFCSSALALRPEIMMDYMVLRKNSSLLVTLFSLMVSCGIPELQREDDIAYLRDNLMSGETDAVASQRLREIISQCLHTRTTQLNDAVHLLVHA